MAHFSTNHAGYDVAANPVSRFFEIIGNALYTLAMTDSRLRQSEALHALSDAELAERGLRRDEIARYVFNDVFWG